MSLLLVHAGLTRLRLFPGVQRFIDPPVRVLIHDGAVDVVNLARCGMTADDLVAVLRQAATSRRRKCTWPCWSRAARCPSCRRAAMDAENARADHAALGLVRSRALATLILVIDWAG